MKYSSCLTGLLALLPAYPLMAQEPIDFVVKSTTERPIEVVQPSEIPGVPPTQATVTATVQLVEDPRLPDLPPPLPPDPAGQASDGEGSGITLACLSATWYPREQVSKVQWQYGLKSFQCISRRNFQHLSGSGSGLQVNGIPVLVLGIGSEDTTALAEIWRQRGEEYLPPVFPAIPAGQDYVVTQGDATDFDGMQVIADLHEKFRTEGAQLEQQWLAREQVLAERRAYLLAHPPIPQDVTIRFWQREHPVGMSAETINPEGGN